MSSDENHYYAPNDPRAVSPKVIAPVVLQLLTLIALGFISGEFNGPEIGLGVSALITMISGYKTKDPARV